MIFVKPMNVKLTVLLFPCIFWEAVKLIKGVTKREETCNLYILFLIIQSYLKIHVQNIRTHLRRKTLLNAKEP